MIRRNPNGNPIITTVAQLIQRVFDPFIDAIRVTAGGNEDYDTHCQAAGAGAVVDFTFDTADSVTVSSDVDCMVTFNADNPPTASNGLYVPAKTPTELLLRAKSVHVFAVSAGKVTILAKR